MAIKYDRTLKGEYLYLIKHMGSTQLRILSLFLNKPYEENGEYTVREMCNKIRKWKKSRNITLPWYYYSSWNSTYSSMRRLHANGIISKNYSLRHYIPRYAINKSVDLKMLKIILEGREKTVINRMKITIQNSYEI